MKKYSFLLSVMAAILLSSCSKVPKYAKVIPDDAAVVIRVDAKQLAEKSGIGENDKAKKKVKEFLKESDLSRTLRNKVEDILEDPASAGVDLAEPMFFYAAPEGNRMTGGFVGAVRSKDDLTDLLNGLAKETDGDKVAEEKGYSYFAEGRQCLVFSDDWFYFGEKEWNEDVEDFADDVNKLFTKESKNSIVDTEDFQKMCDAEGVVQMLVSGKGIASIEESKELNSLLPDGLDVEDVSYLLDLTVDKGEAALVAELLTNSSKWNEYMEKYDDQLGDVKGDLLKYIQKEGFAFFANLDGEVWYEQMKDLGVLNSMDSDSRDMVKKVLRSIKGDVAVGVTDFDAEQYTPTMAAYLQTKDNSIVNIIAQFFGQDVEQKASNQYTVPLGFSENSYGQSASSASPACGFGYKNNVSYVVMGNNPKEFATPSGAFVKSDLKGKKAYVYFGFDVLKKLGQTLGRDEKIVVDGLLKICDFAEFYYEGGGKSVLRLVTKDKDVTPLSALISYAVSVVEKFEKGSYVDEDDFMADDLVADSLAAVDDYMYADTAAAW